MLLPTNIINEVETILLASPNYLSAYQILARLPANLRSQLLVEKGIPGFENGNSFTAASTVSKAAEMLFNREICTRIYCEGNAVLFEIDGNIFRPGNAACAYYCRIA